MYLKLTTPQTAPYQKIKPIWRHAHFLFPVLYLCAIPLLYSPLRWMLATDLGSSSSSSTALDDSGRPIDQSLLLYFPAALFPLKVWPQVDATFFIAAGTSAFVFITLVSGGTAAGFSLACNRYEVLSDQRLEIDRKKLPATVSLAILTAHRSLHRWLSRAVFYLWIAGIVFCYLHGVLINAAWGLSTVKDALFLLFIFPLYLLYMIYGLFGVSIFVVMSCTFFNICQRHQLNRLQTIERLLLSVHSQPDDSNLLPVSVLKRCWLQYLSINRSIISLAVDIERFSALWSFTLTIYLSGYISLQCYLMYISFFITKVSFASRFIFQYGLAEVELFQCLIVHIAAKVARTNSAIEKENQKLSFLLSQLYLKQRSSSSSKVDLRSYLKAEWLQRSQRLKPYCMHLLDNYRITSKTFYMSLSYNVLFFLVIFKRQ